MNNRPSLASLAPSNVNSVRPRSAADGLVSDAATDPVQSAGASPATPAAKAPAPYKAILSKVDDKTHKQLKRLAVDEGKPVGDLQIEALNLLFKSRGLDQIAVRVTPDERARPVNR